MRNGRAIGWLPEELAWIEARKEWPLAQRWSGFCFRFGRTDVSRQALHALCKRKGWKTGRDGRFAAGQGGGSLSPEHRAAFLAAGAKTRFKKGDRPHTAKPVGYERLDHEGYVQICVDEPNPWTGHRTRMKHKHRWLWEKANGPVPEGHRLKCLDGFKTNCDPSNWEAIPAALAPRLNGRFGRGYDEAPAELKPTIMAIAKLEHKAREAKRGRAKA